jgi:hypothetical protein
MTAKIKLNAASGGGSVSIQAPSSSSNNRVISLPDIADGTLVTSQSTLDATKLSGNLPAISGAALTGISAGITALNVWYLTTSFSGNADPVVNWAKYDGDNNTAGFGSDMTESSGIWTFPSTGFWEIRCSAYLYNNGNTAAGSVAMSAYFTVDGSNYDSSGNKRSYSNLPHSSGYYYSQNINIHYFDVTDTSTHKMKVRMEGSPPNVNAGGTMLQFIRLADT